MFAEQQNGVPKVASSGAKRGGISGEEGTFLRRGPKAAQRRAREAQRRAREATRAAKASQNGDKRETKAKRWRGAKPFGYTYYITLSLLVQVRGLTE